MKAVWLLALSCAVTLAVSGCRNSKPEPIPPPKARSGTTAQAHARTAGIAWFQGSLEQAFSKAAERHGPVG